MTSIPCVGPDGHRRRKTEDARASPTFSHLAEVVYRGSYPLTDITLFGSVAVLEG